MAKNQNLHHQIIIAGEQAGLFLDDGKFLHRQQPPTAEDFALTELVFFTLRPVEEYMRHYRGSWTQMKIKPMAADEMGDDGLGVALIFETDFRLAYVEGYSSDDPGLVIDDILARIEDFIRSYPAEAADLFVIPFMWDMSLQGEIIYEPDQGDQLFLDFDMHPSLEVHAPVIEMATVTEFETALANLSDNSVMGLAIREAMQRLALFCRWLDTETPPRPPRSSLLEL